ELPKEWPELVAQLWHAAGKEPVDRWARCREIGAVRREARRFQREDEIRWRFIVPAAKARRLLRTVEGAVDLDCGDLAARMGELARLPQARRVEYAAPWRINPAADPDADVWSGAHQ